MENLITSQDFIDNNIVSAKISAADFEVLVSPSFEIDGVTYRVVLDGHHSLAAAIIAKVNPIITEATATTHDAVGLLDDGDIETFMEITHMGSDYRFAVSGNAVW